MQRAWTGVLRSRLAGRQQRAQGRIDKELATLATIGIHAPGPAGVVAPKAKQGILRSLLAEARLLGGARRQALRRQILGLRREIAGERALMPEWSTGVSTPYGIYVDLEHAKGPELTQILAHEKTHAGEMVLIHRMARKIDRLAALPKRTPGQERRLQTLFARAQAIAARNGMPTGEHEVRADFAGAYALGSLGKPLMGRHFYGWSNGDPSVYPPARMAKANVVGYMKGAQRRLTAGGRRLDARQKAYLAGYRAALKEGAEGSLRDGPLPPGPPLTLLERVRWGTKDRLAAVKRSVRRTSTADQAEQAGWSDAWHGLPPKP